MILYLRYLLLTVLFFSLTTGNFFLIGKHIFISDGLAESNTKDTNINKTTDQPENKMANAVYKKELDRILKLMKEFQTHADDSHPRYQKIKDFLEAKLNNKKDIVNDFNKNNVLIKSLPKTRIYTQEILRLETLKNENKNKTTKSFENFKAYSEIQKFIISLIIDENKNK